MDFIWGCSAPLLGEASQNSTEIVTIPKTAETASAVISVKQPDKEVSGHFDMKWLLRLPIDLGETSVRSLPILFIEIQSGTVHRGHDIIE